ncbi:hypothetical protein GCM10014715_11100 [Streptomyces spiralis]|uniref:Uncharacterized protein n=1 Tax=Streptomyces spiralis TaxID=66376 RepID=A0A918ZNS5_9ACTN|nr:hypothetical protein GCM10014715_11100 [Streptomyces spiralis]
MPQAPHSFELGKKRSITTSSRPYQAHLYSEVTSLCMGRPGAHIRGAAAGRERPALVLVRCHRPAPEARLPAERRGGGETDRTRPTGRNALAQPNMPTL